MIHRIIAAILYSLLLVPVFAQTTIQEKLGYPKNARLLILHADDAGVSHSENAATMSAMEKGCINSASIMVPCPWFPEIASYARSHPDRDFGLHLTLTSEWNLYKWGPVSSKDKVPGLINSNGYFFSTVDSVKQAASEAEVETEIRNQVKTAMAAGVDPTHLDAHMFTLFSSPEFLRAYLKVGHEFRIPVFLHHGIEEGLKLKLDSMIGKNDIIFDAVVTALPEYFKTGIHDFYIRALKELKPGLTYFIIHTAYDDSEMKAVTVGFTDWGSAWRQHEYDFFSSEECKRVLKENHIFLVSWKEIRDKITRK